jgi:hypothetical protein
MVVANKNVVLMNKNTYTKFGRIRERDAILREAEPKPHHSTALLPQFPPALTYTVPYTIPNHNHVPPKEKSYSKWSDRSTHTSSSSAKFWKCRGLC